MRVPLLYGEADDMAIVLSRLLPPLGAAVKAFWRFEGKPLLHIARRLELDSRTFVNRVLEGHRWVRVEFERYKVQCEHTRAILEAGNYGPPSCLSCNDEFS